LSTPTPPRGASRRILALVTALGALHACGPVDEVALPLEVFTERFDAACDGIPCGYTQRSGPPGGARTTSTLLPGLRGLALAGDGVVVDGPAGEGPLFGASADQLDAVMFARCDAEASLTVRFGVTGTGDFDASTPVTGVLLEAQLRPPPTWVTTPSASAAERAELVPIGLVPFTSELRIVSVSIEKRGPGQCEIDELRIELRGFDGLDFEGGCG
jgi:hypothetical protein